jgi:4-amino-4-deoxy-L-arabinose transferase-like glycosyltransferase
VASTSSPLTPSVSSLKASSHGRVRDRKSIGALAVAIGALALRLPAISFGLPYLWHPDEPTNVYWGARMADTNSLLPHFYNYPSFMFDVIAVVARVQLQVSSHVPKFGGITRQGLGIGYTSDPHLWLALRFVTALFSTGLCLIVYITVLRLTGRVWAALLAGGLLAVSPLVVTNGVFITSDTYSAFFAAAAIAASLAVLRRGRLIDYIGAGAAAGLATGSKYNAAIAVLPVIVAHMLRYRGRAFHRASGLLPAVTATFACAAALLASTPAILFDSHEFFSGLTRQLLVYSQSHPDAEREATPFFLSTLWHDEPVLLIGAAVSLWALHGRLRRETIVVWAYAVGYFALIASQRVSFSRYLMPLEPALAILTGLGAAALLYDLTTNRAIGGTTRRAVPLAIAGVLLVSLAPPATVATSVPTAFKENQRFEAAAWIDAHIPHGSVVLLERYGPYLNPHDYHVVSSERAIEHRMPRHVAAIVLTTAGERWFERESSPYRGATAYAHLRATYCKRADFTGHDLGLGDYWIAIWTPC